MASLHALRADALALRDLRRARARPLPCPPELTPTLRTQIPPHPGYAFSWGQIIEWPGDVLDPHSEGCTGLRWSIVPASVWHAALPRMRAKGWQLQQLLQRVWHDGADCVEGRLPPFIHLDAPLWVAVAGFITLSPADAFQARRWLADSFLTEDLPVLLERYEEELLRWIENYRQPYMAAPWREGDRRGLRRFTFRHRASLPSRWSTARCSRR